MIALSAPLQWIQTIRFVSQLADHVTVALPRNTDSEQLVVAFPSLAGSIVLLDGHTVRPEPVRVCHAAQAIGFRGVTVTGPSLPGCLKRKIEELPREKTLNYTFMGCWSLDRGRQLSGYETYCCWVRRDRINRCWDHCYWDMLCRSRFALCPSGECRWLYRVYEAMLARAIPVLTEQQYGRMPDYDRRFRFYVLGQEKEYRPDWAEENYARLFEFNRRAWRPLLDVLS